jgi:hypothetical protein
MRCSTLAQSQNADPIGTAGTQRGYLVVEHRLPWPSDAAQMRDLSPHIAEAARRQWRLQVVAMRPGDQRPLVARYWRDAEAFTGFESDATGRHVLICTHGRRDACCGSAGTRLFQEVGGSVDGVEFWRSSHLGGHRFAPTALVLPEGTMWAHLDARVLVGIATRTLDVNEALGHYRGCTGLAEPEVQAADRAALALHGWAWLDRPREGHVVRRAGDRVDVRLTGGPATYTATVEIGRRLPSPDCGSPADEATKYQPEYRVGDFAAVVP